MWVFKDLTNAKLMIRFGPVLFMHGALPFVPNDKQVGEFPTPWIQSNGEDDAASCDSLTNWIDHLNNFASSQVKGWKEYQQYCIQNPLQVSSDDIWASEGGYYNKTQSGKMFGALIQYGMGTLPDHSKTLSCVYNSWMDDGLPRDDMFGSDASLKQIADFMVREGVQLILGGHQPVGDAPWPIQVSRDEEGANLFVVSCDHSYSGDARWTSIRGSDSSKTRSLGRGSSICGRGDVSYRYEADCS